MCSLFLSSFDANLFVVIRVLLVENGKRKLIISRMPVVVRGGLFRLPPEFMRAFHAVVASGESITHAHAKAEKDGRYIGRD